jgi:ATP-dependent protease ClpP protease subunit
MLEQQEESAEIYIFGDILEPSWAYGESDVSGWSLAKDLQSLGPDVTNVTVRINSYGGNVSEGLAIHNLLASHPATVTTVCEGFACSAASVVFMAGDVRVMREASLLLIHNAWSLGAGDPNDLRKLADDLETVTAASKAAYMARVSITEDELTRMMDAETWILPQDAVEMGFATRVDAAAREDAAQSARQSMMFRLAGGCRAARVRTQDLEPIRIPVEESKEEPKERKLKLFKRR